MAKGSHKRRPKATPTTTASSPLPTAARPASNPVPAVVPPVVAAAGTPVAIATQSSAGTSEENSVKTELSKVSAPAVPAIGSAPVVASTPRAAAQTLSPGAPLGPRSDPASPRQPSWTRILVQGAGIGALVQLLLFGLSVWLHQSAEYMGVEDDAVTTRVTALFEDAIIRQQLGLLALAAAVGAVLGLVGALAVDAWVRRFGHRRAMRRRWPWVLLVVLWCHQHLLMASMAHIPAVYAPGAEQSTWIDVSLTLAVDVLPRSWIIVALYLPLAFTLAHWVATAWVHFTPRIRAMSHPRQLRLAAWSGLGMGLLAATMHVLLQPMWASLPGPVPAPRPNVLLLAVDSLRADALLPQGERPVPAAHIAAFAQRATHFSRAVPTVPRTYPSWASMLTGLYPHHHGIRHMFPPPPEGGRIRIAHTLPTILAGAGYRTAAFSDFAGDVFQRADFGFEHVEAPEFTLASNVALGGLKLHLHLMPWLVDVLGARTHPELLAFERLSDPALVRDRFYTWLSDVGDDGPWFATVFLSAGHFPFASPSPFWSRYVDPEYRGPSRFQKSHFSADLNDASADAAHLKGLYMGAIAASDDAIGHMLAHLEAAGQLANTIVIITADHGENLYEHGLGTGHGDHLYGRETIEVPLIIDYPANDGRGRVIDTPVSLVDLSPTVLGRLGLSSSAPAAQVAGVDLFATPLEVLRQRPIFAEIDLWFFPPETRRLDEKRIIGVEGFEGFDFDPQTSQIFLHPSWEGMAIASKHRMVLSESRKLIYVPTRDGVRLELYDPLHDPGDTRDLAATEPETRERLRALLYQWMLLDPQVQDVHGWVLPRTALHP